MYVKMEYCHNSASTNMQAKRPRMEEQGDHEMDMFERKSQMQVL